MHSHTESCVISKPKSEVFGYLSDITNLPKWSSEFIKEIKTVDGQQKAVTSIGEVFIRFETDAKTGVIDIFVGPTKEHMTVSPLRVIGINASTSAVVFTIFQYPDVDNQMWHHFCDIIKTEVENIQKILS